MTRIKITARYDLVTKVTHRKIMRSIMRAIGNLHKRKTIKKHFEINKETRAGGTYDYEKRSRKYQLDKARQRGHQRPLVKTGRMRSAVLGTSVVRATKNKWTYQARNYFRMLMIRREELEAVSPDEFSEYVDRLNDQYIRQANAPGNQRKTKKRIS